MTKKDYVAIGKALQDSRRSLEENLPPDLYGTIYCTIGEVTEKLSDVFAADNPLFDRARFLRFVETGKDTPAAKNKNLRDSSGREYEEVERDGKTFIRPAAKDKANA